MSFYNEKSKITKADNCKGYSFFDKNAKLLENAKFICYNELKLNIDK